MMQEYTKPDYAKDQQIRRRVLVGTTGNVVAQVLVFAVSFVLTPFILNQLGATIYGLWILLGSVIAYTSILDFGIWGTVIKHVAEYQAQKNYTGARALLGTVLCVYLAIAALIALAGTIAAPFVPQLFRLPAEQRQMAVQLVILLSLSTGLAIPALFPMAILRGLQRYDAVNAIDITTTIITALATVAVLWLGGGVIGLAMIGVFTLTFSFIAGLWTLRRLAPEVEIDPRGANWLMARKIYDFTWPLFMRDLANRLQTRTDEITIGLFLPVSAVGSYSIARRLSETPQTLTRQFMKTLLPLASQLHAEEDHSRLRALYKTGTRLTIAIVLVQSAILFVLGGSILSLWVGASYAAYGNIVMILTTAFFVGTVQWPAMAILQAMARHRILAFSSLGNGLANLILSLLLVRPYGLIGVALGSAIPIVVECFCVVLPYSLRVTGIHLGEAVQDIFMPALLPAVPSLIVLYLMRVALEPLSLITLLLVAVTGAGVYGLAYLSLGGNQGERKWVVEMISFGYRLVTANRKQMDA